MNLVKILAASLKNYERFVWCEVTACAISGETIWGPYFFEEIGSTVTVNTEKYCEMLRDFVQPKLEELESTNEVYFPQDVIELHALHT